MRLRHHHKWELVSKEFVKPAIEAGELSVERGTDYVMGRLQEMMQGYWSYVFRCPCGETKVRRS